MNTVPATSAARAYGKNSKNEKVFMFWCRSSSAARIFGGVPIIVNIPPNATPNATGMKRREGAIFDSCDRTATAGITKVAAETLFMNAERTADTTITSAIEIRSFEPAWC
jgi:hypothetical protein